MVAGLPIAFALAGCTTPRTELVVNVTSDLPWGPGQVMQALRVTVRRDGPEGATKVSSTRSLGPGGDQWSLPMSFGLVPGDGTEHRVWVEVVGCRDAARCNGADALVTQRVAASYRAEATLQVDAVLWGRCQNVSCDAAQGCEPESMRCVSAAQVGAATLRPLVGDAPSPLDAGVAPADAGADVPADAGADVPADVPADVTADRPADVPADVPSDVPTDAGGGCEIGQTSCGGTCRWLMGDPMNCGACGNPCVSGMICITGVCVSAAVTPQESCRSAPSLGCGLISIPGNTFTMGEAAAERGAPPQPGVRVSAFRIDAYEVTVSRFRRWWDVGHPAPSGPVAYPGGVMLPFTGVIDRDADLRGAGCEWSSTESGRYLAPMNCVTWSTAQAFCVWDGGRLPTQAEWELAARGVDDRVYPWGAVDIEDSGRVRACWSGRGNRTSSCIVGYYNEGDSAYGVHDMAGNVWEWNADWYAPYGSGAGTGCWTGAARTDPLCLDSASTVRVMRGGSFASTNSVRLRAGTRGNPDPNAHFNDVGFRCARGP